MTEITLDAPIAGLEPQYSGPPGGGGGDKTETEKSDSLRSIARDIQRMAQASMRGSGVGDAVPSQRGENELAEIWPTQTGKFGTRWQSRSAQGRVSFLSNEQGPQAYASQEEGYEEFFRMTQADDRISREVDAARERTERRQREAEQEEADRRREADRMFISSEPTQVRTFGGDEQIRTWQRQGRNREWMDQWEAEVGEPDLRGTRLPFEEPPINDRGATGGGGRGGRGRRGTGGGGGDGDDGGDQFFTPRVISYASSMVGTLPGASMGTAPVQGLAQLLGGRGSGLSPMATAGLAAGAISAGAVAYELFPHVQAFLGARGQFREEFVSSSVESARARASKGEGMPDWSMWSSQDLDWSDAVGKMTEGEGTQAVKRIAQQQSLVSVLRAKETQAQGDERTRIQEQLARETEKLQSMREAEVRRRKDSVPGSSADIGMQESYAEPDWMGWESFSSDDVSKYGVPLSLIPATLRKRGYKGPPGLSSTEKSYHRPATPEERGAAGYGNRSARLRNTPSEEDFEGYAAGNGVVGEEVAENDPVRQFIEQRDIPHREIWGEGRAQADPVYQFAGGPWNAMTS